VDVDYEDIGIQTAELILRKLARVNRTNSAIQHPRKVLLYINKGVASSLGLTIPIKIEEQAISVKSGR